MSASPFRVECDRCGEPYYPDKAGRIFEVGYRTVGDVDGNKVWRTLNLCTACQQDLRLEFYRGGMMRDAT